MLPFTTDFILSSTEYQVYKRMVKVIPLLKTNQDQYKKNNNEGKKTLNLKERNKTKQIIQQ